MLMVTTITAAILTLLHIRLAIGVIGFRRKYNVSIGDGGQDLLARAIRAHGNSSEYIPVGLILLACLEFNGAPIGLTGPLAAIFICGRLMHPIGIRTAEAAFKPRVLGMQLTLYGLRAMAIINCGWLIWKLLP